MIFSRMVPIFALLLASPTQAAITCGATTAFKGVGDVSAAPVVKAWATKYSAACSNTITITPSPGTAGGGSGAGAQAVCAGTAEIALLNRRLLSSEATRSKQTPYKYTCAGGRALTEVEIAVDGLAFIAAPGGIAAKCIASLSGGGLTYSQIRFAYSSYTLSKLKLDPFYDPFAVLNSDGNDATRLWSELCLGSTCKCPTTPIRIAGPPSTSGPFIFLIESFLTGSGETVRVGYQSDPNDAPNFVPNLVTASGNDDYIGFTSFAPYNSNSARVYAAAVQDAYDFVWRFPSFSEFASGEYPASFPLYIAVADTALPLLRPFLVYAYSNDGNKDVQSTGLNPIADIAQIRQLSRLGAPGGVNIPAIASSCGPTGQLFQGGSSVAYPLAYLWGNIYADACGLSPVLTLAGGTALGVGLACGVKDAVTGQTADIGTLGRIWTATEATVQKNGYDYKCNVGTKRVVRNFPVAIDGITLSFPLNQVGAKCIATLPGQGLSVDQIRWIFSSFTFAQLTAGGWPAATVPNSDGSDSTHLWSELGGSACEAKEIATAGPPANAGTFTLFAQLTLKGTGETIALSRSVPFFSVPDNNPGQVVLYLQNTPDSLGFFGYNSYNSNKDTLGAAAVKNRNGVYVAPTEATLGDFSYNPYSRYIYFELSTVYLVFQKTIAYVKFGITTSIGDQLTSLAGFAPLSAATKATLTEQYKLDVPCFSETGIVEVFNQGPTVMKNLKLGDKVLNAQGKYDTVYTFAHYGPDMDAGYVQIHASSLKKPLELSQEHMLFVNGNAVPASSVSVGDKLTLASGGVATVTKIQSVVRHGAYAPFTMSGTIFVNDVAASVYVDLQNHNGRLTLGGKYKTPLSMQFLAHMFQAPHRLVCRISPQYCRAETYDERGVSTWVAGPLDLAEWAIRQHWVRMTMVFAPCFLLGALIYAVEVVLTSKTILLLLATIIATIRLARRNAGAVKKSNQKEL